MEMQYLFFVFQQSIFESGACQFSINGIEISHWL